MPPGARLVEHLLQRGVGHRRDQLEQRRQRPARIGATTSACSSAEPKPTTQQREAGCEVVLLGHERRRRRAQAGDEDAHVRRAGRDEVAAEAQRLRARGRGPRRRARGGRVGPTSCSRYSKEVTTPKLPPPPRSAQKRSGFSSAEARRTRPSAVTTSAATRLSALRPALRLSQPMPPPSVSPPMPVWLTKPPGVARPCACVARVDVGPGRAAAADGAPRRRVDRHLVHAAEVDHQPAVADREPGVVVAAAADGDLQPGPRANAIACGDVGRGHAAHDHCRAPVDCTVPDRPRGVVAVVGRPEHLAGHLGLQPSDFPIVDLGHRRSPFRSIDTLLSAGGKNLRRNTEAATNSRQCCQAVLARRPRRPVQPAWRARAWPVRWRRGSRRCAR